MGIYNTLKEEAQKAIIRKILVNLGDISNENLIRLTYLFEKLTPATHERFKRAAIGIRKKIQENHPSVEFLRRILRDMDPNCREKFVDNLIIRGFSTNHKKRREYIDKGIWPPMTVLISPTMRCNLNCIGCYAGNYSKKDDLGFETFDKIINESEEMGIGFFTILGGEPFVIKEELFKICKKHNKSYFQVYTNGVLINKKIAEEIRQLGNLLPILSIEGYKKETDERRGKGTYEKVMKAMKILKEKKIPFGFSVAVTRKNAETICSDEFLDDLIKRGAFLGWYFLYMPIGKDPDVNLMPTPQQRKLLNGRWREVRKKKPIFIVDFWNDAPFVGGCIAGKNYIHITSKGDVEPCIFTHFAVDNIKEKSLAEVMESEFFKELRKRQPFNENHYLPCMWIDNPEVGREICKKYHCYPTHKGADSIIENKNIKKYLDKYSKEVEETFKDPWKDWEERKKQEKKVNC